MKLKNRRPRKEINGAELPHSVPSKSVPSRAASEAVGKSGEVTPAPSGQLESWTLPAWERRAWLSQ